MRKQEQRFNSIERTWNKNWIDVEIEDKNVLKLCLDQIRVDFPFNEIETSSFHQ